MQHIGSLRIRHWDLNGVVQVGHQRVTEVLWCCGEELDLQVTLQRQSVFTPVAQAPEEIWCPG